MHETIKYYDPNYGYGSHEMSELMTKKIATIDANDFKKILQKMYDKKYKDKYK